MEVSRILDAVTDNGKQKFVSATFLVVCAGILWVAAMLKPDSHGLGTHQQLHLPKVAGVEIHMPPCGLYALTGIPCATCGMTTAFSYGIRGRFKESFLAQPFGMILFLVTAVLLVDSVVALCTNRTLRRACLPWKKIWIVGIMLLAVAWAYKIWAVRHSSG